MQSVVFGQKLKKGCLITLLSFVFVVPIVGSFGVPNVVYAQGTDASQFVPANAPANTPPATPANATNESDKGVLDQAIDGIKAGFAGAVNLLMITFVQIIMKFIEFLAFLFSFAIGFLQTIIKYNDYATQREVSIAWAIVRDSINSFFIVVLIAIAISTIIRFQPYNFRSTLPRLILAALLVNFSKAICLLAISFANSVMLTFSDALIEILPVYALGLRLPALTALDSASIGGIGGGTDVIDALAQKPLEILNILVATVLGAVMMMFALGGFAMFVIILLFRIIVLWFLIILSPLAFFLWGVPGRGASYWGQWLEEFIKHLIVGPIGAFFLYIIALFYVSNIQNSYGFTFKGQLPEGAVTVASSPQILIGYFVSLGMMFIALEIIEQLGVRGGQFAKQVGIDGIAKGAYAKTLARGVGAVASYANDQLYGTRLGWMSYRGGSLSTLKDSFNLRRQEAVSRGDALMSTLSQQAAKEGNTFGAMRYALAGKNTELLKKISGPAMLGRTAKGLMNWSTGGLAGRVATAAMRRAGVASMETTTNAQNEIKRIDATNTAVNLAESLAADGSNVSQQILGMTKDQLKSAKKEDYQEAFFRHSSKVDELEARIRGGDNSEITRAELEREKTLRDEANEMESGFDKVQAAQNQFANEKGLDAKGNETLASFSARVGATPQAKSKRDKRKQALAGVVMDRMRDAQAARGTSAGNFRKAMRGYYQERYGEEKDMDVSKQDIILQMRGNEKYADRHAWGAEALKAAEQGDFDDVMFELVPNLKQHGKIDAKGVEMIAEYAQNSVGMSKDETMHLLMDVEARNKSKNKYMQMGFTKIGIGGTAELTSQSEQNEIIKKKLSKVSMDDLLIKAKPDGLGYTDKEIGDVVAEHLQNNISVLNDALSNRNKRTSFDATSLKNIKKLMQKNKLTGLNYEAQQFLRSLS